MEPSRLEPHLRVSCGNAEGRYQGWTCRVEVTCMHLHLSTPLLDVILTFPTLTPWQDDDILSIEGGDKILPLLDLDDVFVESLLCTLKHCMVNVVEIFGNLGSDGRKRHLRFVTVISANSLGLVGGDVSWADLETDGNTL
jgi:hypothetical protein